MVGEPPSESPMNIAEYYEEYGGRITQDSERLFVEDFLYPLLGNKIEKIIPQYLFIDRTGRSRKIDFAVHRSAHRFRRANQ
jgi:hypothetical protein